eukprot:3774755-Amphidinium_carterae.1
MALYKHGSGLRPPDLALAVQNPGSNGLVCPLGRAYPRDAPITELLAISSKPGGYARFGLDTPSETLGPKILKMIFEKLLQSIHSKVYRHTPEPRLSKRA